MNKFFKLNFLYFSLLLFIILNLSCEKNDVYGTWEPEEDPNFYYFDITNAIIGNDIIDYSDNDADYTLIYVSLFKTTDFNDIAIAPLENITVSWDIDLIPNISISKLEDLDGNEINNGDTVTLDESGGISLKWIDNGLDGNVVLNCSYLDNNNFSWNSSNQNDVVFANFNLPEYPLENTFIITPISYDLDLSIITISYPSGTDNEGDYSDNTTFSNLSGTSHTILNISLIKNEINMPADSKDITVQWNQAQLTQPDGTFPYLINSFGSAVENGGSISTNDMGQVLLYWIDNSISSENIVVSFSYTDINDNTYSDTEVFSVSSQYEKVQEIIPIINPTVTAEGGGTVYLNPIEAYVRDIQGQGVENIEVHITPIITNGGPSLIFPPNGMIAITDSYGLASFTVEAVNVNNDATIYYNFSIENENIANNSIQAQSFLSFEVANEILELSLDPVEIFDIQLDPDFFIFNDLPGASNDSTYTDSIIIEAIAKRGDGTAIPNLNVYFASILPSSGISYGVIDPSALTNQNGVARNVIRNINITNPSATDTITIKASILGEGDIVYETTGQSVIMPLSLNNIYQVSNLEFDFDQNINFTIDADDTFSDTLTAQVLSTDGAGVRDVPINFSLISNDIGYITSALEYSDSLGFASIVYNVSGSDFQESDGGQSTINITARVSDALESTLNRTYSVAPSQQIHAIELELIPDTLIYEDNINSSIFSGIVDTLYTFAYVKDENGVGINGVPVSFANNTPEFGILSSSTVYTDDSGVASNNISNISIDSFDFENNTTESIEVSIQAVGEDNAGFPDIFNVTMQALVVPRSVYNIWKVQDLDVYFEQQLNVIDNISIAYEDQIVAQVLDSVGSPVSGVPINFELLSDDNIGYITNESSLSDSLGFSTCTFHVNPSDFQDLNRDNTTISINTTIGDFFSETITKTYQIVGNANVEYLVDELYPVSYVPVDSNFNFYVDFNSNIQAYENQSLQLCFQTKDENGVVIKKVPLQFSLSPGNPEINPNLVGSISESILYTCCLNESEMLDPLYLDDNGFLLEVYLPNTSDEGTACFSYNVEDISTDDFDTFDVLTVSVADPLNQTLNLHEISYNLGLTGLSGPQTVGSLNLSMEHTTSTYSELFLFNDLPALIDTTITNEITLSANLLDANNASFSNYSINFIKDTQYGSLISNAVITNEFGSANNSLTNIASNFYQIYDYNNFQDTISVTTEARDVLGNLLATDSDTIIIVPKSIYNTNLVNDLTFQFVDPGNYIINQTYDNSDFTDVLLAQVLSESSSPVQNVPVNFGLIADSGYMSEPVCEATGSSAPCDGDNNGLVYSDINGQSGINYKLSGASISQIANSDDRELSISVTTTVGANSITVTRDYTIIPLPVAASIDLDAEIDTLLFNDLPSSVDSSETVNQIDFYAYVRDNNDALITASPILVSFENLSTQYGDLTSSIVYTDSTGSAINTLRNIDTEDFNYSMYSDSIKIRINVPTTLNGVQVTLKDSAKVIIVPKSLENINKVNSLSSYFSQNLSTINNVTTVFSDTLTSQVLDLSNTPVQNVPINFSLSSPTNIGYITNQIGYSDSLGYARTVFSISPADMELFESEEITISVTVGQDFSNTINRTYVVDGSVNIQNQVENLISTTILDLPVVGYPDSLLVGNYNQIEEQFCVTAIDDDGIAISGVPIEFELFGQTEIQGNLSSNLVYTYPDSSYSSESTCVDSTLGSACVCYNLAINSNSFELLSTNPDSLRAHIPDPDNQSIDLKSIDFAVDIVPSSNFVSDMNAYAEPSFIAMNVLDSTYCDTIYAVPLNNNPLKDIPVLFELEEADEVYGFLTKTYAVTDSLPYPPYLAATTAFCTWNNIPDLPEPVMIDITASVQLSDPLLTSLIQIPLAENLPDCPDCEESIIILSEYNELPNIDDLGNNIYSTTITATVIDSTENPVNNTLVQWEALKEDDTGGLTIPIGSIDPFTFTNESGITSTTFSMGNDQGLAYIIATAPEFNLSDTTFVELSSTEAAYLELVQPVPNEIMVQGGGGIESTEIEIEVKDGNGSLVTDDYLVYFRLGYNAPNNSYLNEDGTTSTCVTSDNGISAITLNSGDQPGAVSIVAALYPLGTTCNAIECTDIDAFAGVCDDVPFTAPISLDDGIAQLAFTPVTIVTGAPYSGQINFSYVDITPITGAGLYQVPLSVQLEDIYANPVADSTNVYIWIEGHKRHWCSSENVADQVNFPGLENEDCTFAQGDSVKWGTEEIIDSLVYVLVNPLPANGFGQPYLESVDMQPGGTSGSLYWEPIPHPGQVEGEAKTGMAGPDGNSYPGIAFSNAYYGTSEIFQRTVLKAMTTNADGENLIIDSRENHMGEPLLLPFQPGTVTATTSLATFDFSLPPHDPDAGGDCDAGPDDTQQIAVTGFLTDFFQYPTGNGRLLLTAPGATILLACNPADTDNDGFVGFCDEDGNGVQSDNETIPNCSDCVAEQFTWDFDDSNNDGIIDDDPSVCITNGQGQCTFLIEYSEIINIPSGPCGGAIGGDIVTYDDWQSDIILNLIDPLQAASPSVTITVIKSENDQ